MSTISNCEFCGVVEAETDRCSVGFSSRAIECHFDCPQRGHGNYVVRAHRPARGSTGFGGVENHGPFGYEGLALRTSIPGGAQCQAVTQGPT